MFVLGDLICKGLWAVKVYCSHTLWWHSGAEVSTCLEGGSEF